MELQKYGAGTTTEHSSQLPRRHMQSNEWNTGSQSLQTLQGQKLHRGVLHHHQGNSPIDLLLIINWLTI